MPKHFFQKNAIGTLQKDIESSTSPFELIFCSSDSPDRSQCNWMVHKNLPFLGPLSMYEFEFFELF